jgi:lipopolysaccharide export system permease protein
MKKIDLYIIKKFLGSFLLIICLLVVVLIIFDFSERIDDFMEKDAPLKEIIFVYYLNFIPYFINMFSALLSFISVIFFTSKMASHTEFIAMLSSGISFRRLLVPYIISALIIALFSVFFSNFIIPPANKKRLEFTYKFLKNTSHFKERDYHLQISPGVFAYCEIFNDLTNVGLHFTLEKIENQKLVSKTSAKLIKYDSIGKKWTMEQYWTRTIDGNKEKIVHGIKLDTVLNVLPNDFYRTLNEVETMNYFELNRFIAKEKLKGSNNIDFYLLEKHRRTAYPFATIVLALIGVSISSRKVRGGIGLHLGMGIAISFTYIMFMQVITTVATYGGILPVFIAVWLPNIIFCLIALYLLKIAPK